MKTSSSATSPSPAAAVPNAMQVFQSAAAGQPANAGPVTGSQINDVMAAYPPPIDATLMGVGQDTTAGVPNAFQVFQNAAAGQSANDGPATGDGIGDVMGAYPSLGNTITAPDMRDPANDDYPLAIQGLLGDGVSAQLYTDALSQLSFDPASPQLDPSSSISDAIAAPDMRDPANDDYPLAIQGLLGDGVSAQPYTDALSQWRFNTSPPQSQLYVVQKGDTLYGITHGDYAEMAAIAQAYHLKLAADGSPIVRPGDRLLIPNTSGLGPAAYRREVGYGRTMIARNAQGIAQRHAAQAAAQKAGLQFLDRIDPPLSTPQNSWGAPRVSTGPLFTPVTPGITANPADEGLVRTGMQPLDMGLNFASGFEGAGWQAEKDLGKLLYNNSPLGVVVGLADKTGWVRNVPDYVPDQRRTLQPMADFGHALVTHPDQVWQGTKQAAGNWWDSLSQGDPNRRARAWGGAFLNGLMAADGVAGAVGLASDVGKLARGSEFLSKLGSRGGEALAPAAAEGIAPNIDDYVAGLYSKATPISTNAGRFEVEQTGPLNYRVPGGGKAVDIDGYSGPTIHEAKYVENTPRSPYVNGSNAPDFVRAKVLAQQKDEFSRFRAVISDPAVPFSELHVLTNEEKAVPYFQNLMSTYGIPGKVVVVSTKVP